MVRLSAALGGPLKCIPATFGKPFNQCEPHEIAVINFGIVGVNTLQALRASSRMLALPKQRFPEMVV